MYSGQLPSMTQMLTRTLRVTKSGDGYEASSIDGEFSAEGSSEQEAVLNIRKKMQETFLQGRPDNMESY
jgi:hypothetical protein